MGTIFNKSGGYRRLYSFNFATIVHLGTISFVRRFVNWKDDPLCKLAGQMVGASRSGKQNIIEGSERGKPMRQRHSAKGDFWGCSDYPACHGVRDIPPPTS